MRRRLQAKREQIVAAGTETVPDSQHCQAMAKRLRTDPATIVRIVRGLGFDSYREFQRHLLELSLAFDKTSANVRKPPAQIVRRELTLKLL